MSNNSTEEQNLARAERIAALNEARARAEEANNAHDRRRQELESNSDREDRGAAEQDEPLRYQGQVDYLAGDQASDVSESRSSEEAEGVRRENNYASGHRNPRDESDAGSKSLPSMESSLTRLQNRLVEVSNKISIMLETDDVNFEEVQKLQTIQGMTSSSIETVRKSLRQEKDERPKDIGVQGEKSHSATKPTLYKLPGVEIPKFDPEGDQELWIEGIESIARSQGYDVDQVAWRYVISQLQHYPEKRASLLTQVNEKRPWKELREEFIRANQPAQFVQDAARQLDELTQGSDSIIGYSDKLVKLVRTVARGTNEGRAVHPADLDGPQTTTRFLMGLNVEVHQFTWTTFFMRK